MGALMRAHDWSKSSVGSPQQWPQALRTAVRILLNTKHPMYIFWGAEGACLYNDAYRQSIGPERHPGSLGQPARQVWDEIWDIIGPQVDQVMSGGGATWHENQLVPITRNGQREDVYWTYSYGPIDDLSSSSGVGGVLIVCTETTETVKAQIRQAFWLKLDDELRHRADPHEVMSVAAAMLGTHIRADRCGYGEIDPEIKCFTVQSDWTNGRLPSLAGDNPIDEFGREFAARFRSGDSLVLDDWMADPRTNTSQNDAQSDGVLGAIVVPLVKEDQLVAAFYVHTGTARKWDEGDELLVRGVAERTWAAVERAQAERATRAAEAGLRELATSLEKEVERRTQETQEKEARLRSIFETSFQFQGLLDTEGRLLDTNSSSLEAIAASLETVRDMPFWHTPWFAGTPGMPERVRSAFEVAIKGEMVREEVHLDLPVGGWRWFDFAMRPVRDSKGQITGVVPEAMETTDRHQAEDALRQAQKLEAMGQLTGGVAHDFNNLLTPIVGSLDMLRRRGVGGDKEQKLIEGALQAADRAKTLVQRLLAFARRQPLQPRPVDMRRVVLEMADLADRTSGPNISVNVDLPSDLPPAIADANQLEMAILNLAVNARDAMPNGGRLSFRARVDEVGAGHVPPLEPGQYVWLSVTDTGTGMDRETMARAIEPFYSTKGLGKGTGLGLSMVHGLALQLGGALRLDSEPGRGTNVDLWFPASSAPLPATEEGEHHLPLSESGRVLLVDDERAARESTAAMLTEMGFEVIEAQSAHEARQQLGENGAVDWLITDYLMPGITGAELAREVRLKHPGTKILIISGYADLEEIQFNFSCLSKPFRRRELVEALTMWPRQA